MSGTGPWRPRLTRRINVFAVVICTLGGVLNILEGSFGSAALMLLFVALNSFAIVTNTKAIRRTVKATTRPDYVAIARMEQEVWGQAFTHAGAPASAARLGAGYADLAKVIRAS